LIIKFEKMIKYISSLIEVQCKKKLVFAQALLPFGTVEEGNSQITHLATPTH